MKLPVKHRSQKLVLPLAGPKVVVVVDESASRSAVRIHFQFTNIPPTKMKI